MSEIPLKLGKYEIRRELGRGAMGVVYEAFDTAIERIVALKTIRRDQIESAEAQEVIERFRREAKAAGRLNHPNIVAIYDFGDDSGTMFIAMEFVSGRELKSSFEANERFDLAEIVRIMNQLLLALDYSHANGVVHRDIKPANIIILPDRQVKVADFGIARIDSSQYTQAGTVFGTPAYMSPEQFMGQVVDGRTDIYSAGIVLYQFLTGERPFTGGATTIMHKALNETPPPPSMLSVQVPKLFDNVVAKAMAKRPSDRYQTARQFAEAIQMAAEDKSAPDPDATQVAGGDATVVNTGTGAAVASATGLPASGSSPAQPASVAAPRAGAPAPAAAAPVSAKKLPLPVLAVVAAGVVVIVAAGYFAFPYFAKQQEMADTAPAPLVASATQGAPAPAPARASPPPVEPGTMLISAIGLADPGDRKYQADKSLLAADLQADSNSQLVEKAIALYVDRGSLAKNYELLRERLMSNSGGYIARIVTQGEPRLGKDGLMYVTTQAAVKVNEVQKSLNRMSREERIQFIRNNGDPKISVSISVRDEGAQAPSQNSQVAENLLKERIKSFGFRVVADEAQASASKGKGADFAVVGEARLKKLSAKLAASGITIEKYLLTSWTVKCVDKQTGEEIYYNNKLPVAEGSWATQEKSLEAIGGKIADEFSRDFFLQHFNVGAQSVALKIDGLPGKAAEEAILRELVGLQTVIGAARRAGSGQAVYDLQLSGGNAPLPDLVSATILKPLNDKLGQACFSLGATAGEEVAIAFEKACGDSAVISLLDSNPPASLYAAPQARRAAVLKDPGAMRKLQV